jgi:hypothetical protein
MVNNDKKEHDRNSGLLLIIFSPIAIIIFTFLAVESYMFRRNATFSTGKVVSYSEYKKGDKSKNFTDIIEYQVGEEVMITEGNTYFKREEISKIGEEISVCYNPKYPQDCRLGSFKEAYQFKLVALGVSFFFLIIGIYQYKTNED